MAAREGVGAALTRRLRIFEESATDGGVLTLLFVRGISREINRKRVTSVEVNSIFGKCLGTIALSKAPAMDGR